jgi:hypothetical protein
MASLKGLGCVVEGITVLCEFVADSSGAGSKVSVGIGSIVISAVGRVIHRASSSASRYIGRVYVRADDPVEDGDALCICGE